MDLLVERAYCLLSWQFQQQQKQYIFSWNSMDKGIFNNQVWLWLSQNGLL
jgi:hypothetical protein